MINLDRFYTELEKIGVDFFTGVPDSLLKSFCAYVTDKVDPEKHIISANEGGAVGLAIGYYLATGKLPLVYLQNSGLGNVINPLTSLADRDVYSIPLLFMIGWRGEPGVKDEPQHVKQGKVTLETLEVLGVPHVVIDENEKKSLSKLNEIVKISLDESRPVAVVVRKNTFSDYKLKQDSIASFPHNREDAIKVILENLSADDVIVSTTGMTSRELFEYRSEMGDGHGRDFLTVGGMGHASQIALGVSKGCPEKNVVCIDGDGAALMHLGSLSISGTSGVKNFKHIVINNGSHDSVGGQPTLAFDVDLSAIAKAIGYNCFKKCDSLSDLEDILPDFLGSEGPVFLEICTAKGNRSDLGRPTTTPIENKIAFMENLGVS